MNQPLISVIIPVYNVEKYLDRCVESVVNQTYKHLEIILVDDGSPDNCHAICDDWVRKDSRIKVIHKENEGVANARNDAIDVATGEYIGFVDSDDYTEPNMYEYLLNNMLKYNAQISVCGYQYNSSGNDVEDETEVLESKELLKKISYGEYNFGVLWNKLYKRSIIRDIRMPDYACSEDLVFNYYTFKNSSRVVVGKSKLYHYFVNENGKVFGSVFTSGAFDAVRARKSIFEFEKDNEEIKPYALYGLISSAFVVISGCIQNQRFNIEKNQLIDLISEHKNEILRSKLFSNVDKIKTLLLSYFPCIYSLIIRKKHENEKSVNKCYNSDLQSRKSFK